MIIRKVEYLIALAKHRHFGRAAETCRVSQPTLSAGIQQLEVDLGVQIVKRGRSFQGFTEAGELVLAWALRATKDAEELRQKLAKQGTSIGGPLRIGVLGSAIPLMKLFTCPFLERFPETSLKVVIQDASDAQHCLEEGSIDVVITYLDADSTNYGRARALYVEEYELLIRRGTRYSGRATVRWEDIEELPLCLLLPESRIFGTRESEALSHALSMQPHITTNAIWLLMDHVRTGKWASVLPRPVRIMIAGERDLEAIPLTPAGNQPTVGIALPRTKSESRLPEFFFDVVTSAKTLNAVRAVLCHPD